jgi:hypothetical protein
MFQWWNEYAKNKTMPTSRLKAKSVSFDEFPTFFRIGQKCLAKLKAEFTNGMTWDVSGDAEYIVADESILSINHGVIRAIKEGSTTVTVKYTDGAGQTFSRLFEVIALCFPSRKRNLRLFKRQVLLVSQLVHSVLQKRASEDGLLTKDWICHNTRTL